MDNRYELLFEQVPIGPVVAPNRFYQVPHCIGFGYRMPNALVTMRGIKGAIQSSCRENLWAVARRHELPLHLQYGNP
ncbi:MAG: hypothetical protein JSV37_12850 [Anaerolineaceae bacterium]|nr:MAG: hypothetical protein JSV37_12850 [Anaerolineaceae bacterium]